MPCLALNTPVILVNKNFNKRFPELYELLNTIGINQKRKSEIKVNDYNNGYVYNSKEYLKFSIRLKEALKIFNRYFCNKVKQPMQFVRIGVGIKL